MTLQTVKTTKKGTKSQKENEEVSRNQLRDRRENYNRLYRSVITQRRL